MFKSNARKLSMNSVKHFPRPSLPYSQFISCLGILRTDPWRQGSLAINSQLKDGAFTAVKRNVDFLTGYVKGVQIANRRYTKGVPIFLSKVV